jgi:hypothetical protein
MKNNNNWVVKIGCENQVGMYYKIHSMVGEKLTLETEVLPHVCLGVGIHICAWVAKIGDTRGPRASREVLRDEVESQSRKREPPGLRREIGAC